MTQPAVPRRNPLLLAGSSPVGTRSTCTVVKAYPIAIPYIYDIFRHSLHIRHLSGNSPPANGVFFLCRPTYNAMTQTYVDACVSIRPRAYPVLERTPS